jgi:predicted ATPase
MSDEHTPIVEITIRGYKSIRELNNFRLNKGLNVVIGANGTGKTNFIRFFELLNTLVDLDKGLQNYVRTHKNANAFLFQGMKKTQKIEAEIIFEENERGYFFTLQGAHDQTLFFAKEIAVFPVQSYNGEDVDILGGREEFNSAHNESKLQQHDPKNLSLRLTKENIQNRRTYHFQDTSPNAPVMGTCNIVDNDVLNGDAKNLAPFLMRIQREYPDHFLQIEEAVRQVAPFFGKFILKEEPERQTSLLWKDRFCESVYYPFQLSDGTLRFICLATLLLQPNPPATIILDEPELGLHPSAIQLLSSMLQEAGTRTQLIVATQSSLLVDTLSPEQVIVVNHSDGESILKRLNSEELKDWLQEYTLGQLWEKNVFGGVA